MEICTWFYSKCLKDTIEKNVDSDKYYITNQCHFTNNFLTFLPHLGFVSILISGYTDINQLMDVV